MKKELEELLKNSEKIEVVTTGLYQDYDLILKPKFGAKVIDEKEVKKVILIY